MANTLKTFYWKGIDKTGKKITGQGTALNYKLLKENLLHKNIIVTSIHSKKKFYDLKFKNKLKNKDIINFTYELSILLNADVNLMLALQLLAKETNHLDLKQIITEMTQEIERGKSFNLSLKKYPEFFDNVYISLVEAGELSGTLKKLIAQLYIYQKKNWNIHQKLKKALFYPIIITLISVIVTICLLIFIVPQFESVFNNMGANLPFLTSFIIQISLLLRNKAGNLILSFIPLFFCSKFYGKKINKIISQNFFSYIPGINRCIRYSNLSRVYRILLTLLQAGFPLLQSLESCVPTLTTAIYQKELSKSISLIKKGYSFQQALTFNPLFFKDDLQLLSIAENAGDLTCILQTLAEKNEIKLDTILEKFSLLIEPLMLLILAGILGTLIVAMYLPIFQLGSII